MLAPSSSSSSFPSLFWRDATACYTRVHVHVVSVCESRRVSRACVHIYSEAGFSGFVIGVM